MSSLKFLFLKGKNEKNDNDEEDRIMVYDDSIVGSITV